jgi:hypothetical protein
MKFFFAVLETLGGARPLPEIARRYPTVTALALALWWLLLWILVLAASGRSTKFVYIDF